MIIQKILTETISRFLKRRKVSNEKIKRIENKRGGKNAKEITIIKGVKVDLYQIQGGAKVYIVAHMENNTVINK